MKILSSHDMAWEEFDDHFDGNSCPLSIMTSTYPLLEGLALTQQINWAFIKREHFCGFNR